MPGIARRLSAAVAVVLMILAGSAPGAHASAAPRGEHAVAGPGHAAHAQTPRTATVQHVAHPAPDLDHQVAVLPDGPQPAVTERVAPDASAPGSAPDRSPVRAATRGPPTG